MLSDWFSMAAEDWWCWQSNLMATGEFHSAAVGEDGALFVWGYGFCGQLERGDTQLPVLPAPKGVAACPSCPSSPRSSV